MFFYFYDTFINDKKNEGLLSQVENRLIELGINGRIEKLSVLKSMQEMIEDGIKKDAHTVIVVGNDETFIKAMQIVADHDVIIGYIPFDSNSRFAQLFGIPDALEACNILSKRLIKKIDLGQANDKYFISALELPAAEDVQVRCDGKYSVSTVDEKNNLSICNMGTVFSENNAQLYPVDNGLLNVVITPPGKSGLKLFGELKPGKQSIFPIKKAKIECKDKTLLAILDQHLKLKMPLQVKIVPKKVKIIMGKDRLILQ